MPKINAIAFGLQDGSGFWRVRLPFGELNKHGHNCLLSSNAINDVEMKGKDVIVLKNVTDMQGIASALAMTEIQGSKVIMDIDDDLAVRKDNPMLKDHEIENAAFVMERTAQAVTAVTTTTEYLAQKIRKITDKPVIVAPNSFAPDFHSVTNKKLQGPLRIIWAGGMAHDVDLKMVAPAVKQIQQKYPVKFLAIGHKSIKKYWGEEVEVCPWADTAHYMEAIAAMGGDIGICPLVDDEFNRCKSPIKAGEFAMLGIPSVCSPTVYGSEPVLHTASTTKEWVDKLSMLIEDPQLRDDLAQRTRTYYLTKYNIEKNYKIWENLFCL